MRWLEINEPDEAVGLDTVLNRAQALAADEAVTPMGEHGGAREGAGRKEKADDPEAAPDVPTCPQMTPIDTAGSGNNQPDDISLKKQYGTSAEYLVRRLKRDAPEIAERLARGEFPSARAAGIAAGIVKVPTPLEQIRRLLPRLTADERETLRRELGEA